jgi:hypothetical protein
MGIPPPAGVPAQGGATPSTPGASTAASTAPKTPQLDPNTDPRFAPTWQSTSPEEQRKIIQQVEKSNPANANLPWMKANLKPEPKQAPAVSHPAVPPVSQNELHTKHQQSKPNPAQTPPKPPGIVLPVLQNGKITYEPWQKDIPMPRDPSQLYGHNPNGGGYFWDPQQHTFRYVEGAENPIPHITEGFKAVFGHNREEDHLNSLKGRPQNAQQPQPRIVTPF